MTTEGPSFGDALRNKLVEANANAEVIERKLKDAGLTFDEFKGIDDFEFVVFFFFVCFYFCLHG